MSTVAWTVNPPDDRGRDGIESWWPTPILIHRWPGHADVNQALEAAILDKMKNSPGKTRSNIGGWHSEEDLMNWPVPAVGQFKSWIGRAIRELHRLAAPDRVPPRRLHIAAWANVNRPGDSNNAHEHGNHSWSGAYYVATGAEGDKPPATGYLEVYDPRAGAGRLNVGLTTMGSGRLIPPMPGLMVVFPAWLVHSVRPHSEPGNRISIAFNVAEIW